MATVFLSSNYLYENLIICRIIQGISLGIGLTQCQLFVNEMSPKKIYRILNIFHIINFAFGFLNGFLFMIVFFQIQNGLFYIIMFPIIISIFQTTQILVNYNQFTVRECQNFIKNNEEKCQQYIDELKNFVFIQEANYSDKIMYEELDNKAELSQIIAGLNLNNKHITQEINEIFNEKNDKKQNRRKSSSQDSRNNNQNNNQQTKQSFKRYMGPHKKSIRNHICALVIGITAYTHGFYPLLQNSIQYFGMGNFGIIAQFAVWFAMVFGGTLSGYISQLFSIRTCMLGGTLFTLMSYCGIVISHYFTKEFYIVFQILEYLGVLFFYCGYQLTYGCQLLQGLQQITNQYWMCIVYGFGNLSCAYFSSYLNGILLKENLNLILGYLIFIFFVPYLYLIQEYSEYSKEDEQIGCCNSEDQNKNTAQYNNVSAEHDNMLELSARDHHDEDEHHEHQEFKQEEEDIEYRKQNFIETDEL